MRAIDGDALEELFREVISGIAKKPEMNGNLEHMVRASAMVIEMIQDAPTIEPDPQWKRGQWLDSYKRQTCSLCKGRGFKSWNYCPYCGAMMKETNKAD